jgi:hypothetical protein
MWNEKQRRNYVSSIGDHLTNRACYCRVWNYDCLVNQTKELTYLANASQSRKVSRQSYDNTNAVSNKTTPWWLKFGAWERVAHLQAALPQYDWVLYGDLDYIKDM